VRTRQSPRWAVGGLAIQLCCADVVYSVTSGLVCVLSRFVVAEVVDEQGGSLLPVLVSEYLVCQFVAGIRPAPIV